MKNVLRKACRALGASSLAMALALTSVPGAALAAEGDAMMYFAYSDAKKDYLITITESEYNDVLAAGNYRKLSEPTAVSNEGEEVYRLFHPVTGEHIYTRSEAEIESLEKKGFELEGLAFRSSGNISVDRYRDPVTGLHAYVPANSQKSKDLIVGYEKEGTAWFFEGEEVEPGVPNPVTKVDSIEALNELADTNLKNLPMVGITDEEYFCIKGEEGVAIADYDFFYEGKEMTIRSANTTEEISGYYDEDGLVFDKVEGSSIDFYSDETKMLARWFTIDGQFVLYADGGDFSDEQFVNMAECAKVFITPGAADELTPIESLIGEYGCPLADRAQMEVLESKAEENAVVLYLEWANSATEKVTYVMTCKYDENVFESIIHYNNGTKYLTTYKEGAEPETTLVNEELEGYFTVVKNTLVWSSANDEECENLAFLPLVKSVEE